MHDYSSLKAFAVTISSNWPGSSLQRGPTVHAPSPRAPPSEGKHNVWTALYHWTVPHHSPRGRALSSNFANFAEEETDVQKGVGLIHQGLIPWPRRASRGHLASWVCTQDQTNFCLHAPSLALANTVSWTQEGYVDIKKRIRQGLESPSYSTSLQGMQCLPPPPPPSLPLRRWAEVGSWEPEILVSFSLSQNLRKPNGISSLSWRQGAASASCPCQSSRVNPAPPPRIQSSEALGQWEQKWGIQDCPVEGEVEGSQVLAESSPWIPGKAQPYSLTPRHPLPSWEF